MIRNAVLLACCAAPAAAQPVVSPAHYATEEGFQSSPYPFGAASRLQQIHQDLIGTPRLISGLTFRRDGRSTSGHAGGTMTLTVLLADGVAGTPSATFAANYAGPTTQVFAGNVSVPAAWATPARASPAPLDLPVPFAAPHAYAGQVELLWETAATAVPAQRVTLDSAQSGFHLFTYGPFTMNGSGCTTVNGPMELRSNVQNQSFPPGVNYAWTGTGAPDSATAALLLGAMPANVPVPGLCTSLHLVPLTSVQGTTQAGGAYTFNARVPDSPVLYTTWIEAQLVALDATQAGLPIAASNGLSTRAQTLTPPAVLASMVRAAGAVATTGSVLAGQAVVVRFD